MYTSQQSLHSENSPPPDGAESFEARWEEYQKKFASDDICEQDLFYRSLNAGYISCHHCSSTDVFLPSGRRKMQCNACGRSSWAFAGTFFEGMRRPRAWHAAIWLREEGLIISDCRFHKLLGISYSTAWEISKKLALVVVAQLLAESTNTMPSEAFHDSICKRSRETPARKHPTTEETELHEHAADSEAPKAESAPDRRQSDESSPSTSTKIMMPQGFEDLAPAAESVYALLSAEAKSFNSLVSQAPAASGQMSLIVTLLQSEGLAIRLPGDHYVRADLYMSLKSTQNPSIAADTEGIVTEFSTFIRRIFHGISRKYLQPFIGSFWVFKDRARWKTDSLLNSCLRACPLEYKEILAYVTPKTVRVA
ncbi:MAG TPA: hypothetical protein V6D17_07635 [Candidatus Obscuribacterales bacterium]